jgi:predicted ATP-grasp superfamily ATP-dependent carboligase
LVAASGIDLAKFVYCRVAGLPLPPVDRFRPGVRVLDPVTDLLAFLELRRAGLMTFGRWIRSLLHRQTFAYFRWSDPLPAIARGFKMLRFVRSSKGRSQQHAEVGPPPAVTLAKEPAAAA